MGLKEEVKSLADLQEIDKETYQLLLRKNTEIPAEIEDLKNQINQKENDFALFKERINKLELEKKNKEGELTQKEEALKKAKAQLYQLKSNKEYQIKLNEIASIEADIACAEEEVLKKMEVIDQEQGRVETEKDAVQKQVDKLKQRIDELKKQSSQIEQKAETLKNKRRNYTECIDKKILSQYESLLEKRNGLAIVPVISSNCGACHMTVTHQKINEIKMYDKLALCESCVRILYIPEDFEL